MGEWNRKEATGRARDQNNRTESQQIFKEDSITNCWEWVFKALYKFPDSDDKEKSRTDWKFGWIDIYIEGNEHQSEM